MIGGAILPSPVFKRLNGLQGKNSKILSKKSIKIENFDLGQC
ncbi:conserved hypothetical protein [delta proteobacterium NaphS2]|nr:conserved hypothetical protein [delta proteobacterium NaphS2]